MFFLKRLEACGVFNCSGRVVDGTWAYDDDEAVQRIPAVEDGYGFIASGDDCCF